MKKDVEMRLVLPKETNIILRRYVMETDKNNKQEAIIYILNNFFKQYYKLGEKK